MEKSILLSTKKILGLDREYDAFDLDVITHINSTFVTLAQLGIGPEIGFMIEDESPTWEDFLGDDKRMNMVKSYVYLKVRILFDPPATSFVLDAFKTQLQEMEWRISVERETKEYVNPNVPIVEDDSLDEMIIDAGVIK